MRVLLLADRSNCLGVFRLLTLHAHTLCCEATPGRESSRARRKDRAPIFRNGAEQAKWHIGPDGVPHDTREHWRVARSPLGGFEPAMHELPGAYPSTNLSVWS